MFDFLSLLDWLALLWFALCWLGYSLFSYLHSRSNITLAMALKQVRQQWLYRLVERELRVADVTAVGVLQRNVTFFASTTIFILAGLLTVLGATDEVIVLVNNLPFTANNTLAAWEFKLLLLIFTFVYAFFKFTWSVRQYNFALTMISAAPEAEDKIEAKDNFVLHTNNMLTTAINSFAHGVRAYSFAMAILAWFIQAWFFMLATVWVLAVLYRREFKSRSLAALKALSDQKG